MESVGTGQFEFINENSRTMYTTAHAAISQLELWDFMKKESDTYMFSSEPAVVKIYAKIVELGYDGHSGASFGFIMRDMQCIAQNGYDKFKGDYLASS